MKDERDREWHIPKIRLDLLGFIASLGYRISERNCDAESGGEYYSDIMASGTPSQIVARLYERGIELFYETDNEEQLKQAIIFRKILRRNNVKYKENLSAFESTGKIRGRCGDLEELAKELLREN